VYSLTISFLAFACISGGMLLGMVLRAILPRHHLSEESKDVLKLGTGMIATMSALVLGLLIASAKSNFDTMSGELNKVAGRIMLLDRVLAHYGPETRETRELLRRAVAGSILRLWPEDRKRQATAAAGPERIDFEVIPDLIRQLSPRNEAQRWLQSRALQVSGDIAEDRWLLIAQTGERSIAMPFLVMLVSWLTIIFASFGLFSPRNSTVIIVLLVCAISAAGALFLILELDSPFRGLLKISSAPLGHALMYLGK